MGVGKLKEPGRGESVGFNLLVFIVSSALAYTSGGYCPSVPTLDGSHLDGFTVIDLMYTDLSLSFTLKTISPDSSVVDSNTIS